MDRHRLPFLHSPHGHHQRALLYHPRPRHQLAMPSLPIYDNMLSPPNHHFPRPYMEDFSPSFLTGPNPGAYGLMRLPPGSSYPMPVDFNYSFPGGLPYPIPLPPSHNAFMSLRKPSDDAALHPQYQAHMDALQDQYQTHMDALQDQVNSFLRLTSPHEPGKLIQKPGSERPDWTGIEASLLGRDAGSNGRTLGDVLNTRLPTLPKLHSVSNHAVDHFTSPPRQSSLSNWHSTLTPPPLHLPTVKQPPSLSHPPPLHTMLERNNSDGKKRKLTSDVESTNQNGVLSGNRTDDLFNDNCVATMPKLPPLLIGNKDLAKKLTAEGNGEVLNLSCSSVKSAASAKRRLASDSPDSSRNQAMVDHCTWEPVDERNQSFTKNQSPNNGTRKNALLRDGGFVKELGAGEHANQRGFQPPSGNRPQELMKSPGSSRSTVSYFPPPQPYASNCLTDIEAMRNAYIAANAREGSLSSSVGCSESESSARFSPPLLPPPPRLGFRGKGCFGAKQRQLISPPGAQHSSVFFPRPLPPSWTEYGRLWDWSGENDSMSLDCGPLGTTFVPDVESRSGSGLCRPGHTAVPSNVREEEAMATEPGSIRIKEEPIDSNPIDCDPFTQSVNDSFGSCNGNGAVSRDKGRSVADSRGVDRLEKYDQDQSHLPEESNTVNSFLNVPFVDSAAAMMSPEFELSSNSASRFRFSSAPASASVERRTSDAGNDGNGEFRCHLCNYNGRSQLCLNKHFRAHGQACKICRYCLKAFERPSDLVRHEERHQKRNHMLASTTNDRPAQSSRFVIPGKRVKRRHPWTCRQCHFTCREARKLIQHTRRAHPIFVDCHLCHMKFISEAELTTHKATCHPVAVGRLDTYCRGVLTATKLVTCEVIGEQEISVDLAELSDLPPDCSGIPAVSNVRDVQCILGKESLDDQCSVQDLGHVNCFNLTSQVGNLSLLKPSGTDPVPEFFPSPVESLCSRAKSPKNPPNSINFMSPKDEECINTAFDRPSSGLTSMPASLSIPKTDDISVVGDTCRTPPSSGNSRDIQRDKPRLSPKHTPRPVEAKKVSEKSPTASVRHAQFIQKTVADTLSPPPQNSPSISNLSPSESSPKYRAASHQKPSLLTKLLTKPKPAKPAVELAPANKEVSETREKEIIETVCALDNDKTVSTDLDAETTNAATENVTAPTDNSTPQVTISKKEQAISKKDRSTNASHKTEISTSVEGIGMTNSRKVFAECNGVEKKTETYVCVRCKYSTNAKFKYQQHLKAHNGRYICKRCNKACIKSSDLYRHWVTHNVKGPDGYFACDSCDFTSPQKYVIEDHMKQHYTLHPQQPQRQLSVMSRCGICQKNVLRSRLFEHKRLVHGKFFLKPRVNSEPGRIETDANGNSIKASLKVFACPQCDRKFTTPSYLLRHHFVHHQPPSDSATKFEENTCSCRFCGVKFEDVDHLQDHEINHILQTCTDTEYVKRCHKRKKTMSIDLKRSSPVALASTKSPKTSPNRRKLSCPHCKKPFKVQYFLDQHLRIHSSERPFVCQQCGTGFAIFQLLNIHRRFKCPHRKTLLSTKKPLLNSCSLNAPDDAFSNASSGSKCGRAVLNGSDNGDGKDCLGTSLHAEPVVEVSG